MMEVGRSPLQRSRRTEQSFRRDASGPSPPTSTGLSGLYENDSNNSIISPHPDNSIHSVTSTRSPLPSASIAAHESTQPTGPSREFANESFPSLVPVGDNDLMSLSPLGIISGNQAVFFPPNVGVPRPPLTGIGVATPGAPLESHSESNIGPRNSDQSFIKGDGGGHASMPLAATGPVGDVDLQPSMATQPVFMEASAPDLNIRYSDGETQAVSDIQLGFDVMQPPFGGETQPPLAGETQPVNADGGFDDMVMLQNDKLTASAVPQDNGDQHALYESAQIVGAPALNITSFPPSDTPGPMEVITETTHTSEVTPDTKVLRNYEELVDARHKSDDNSAVEDPFQSETPGDFHPPQVLEPRTETVLSTEVPMANQGRASKEEGLDTIDPPIGLPYENVIDPPVGLPDKNVHSGQKRKDEVKLSENGVTGNAVSGKREAISEEDIKEVMGKKVLKKFGRKNYEGDVVDFDVENQWFKVVYEDGDQEDLELDEVMGILFTEDKLANTFKGKRKRSLEAEDASNQQSRKQRQRKGQGSRMSKATPKKKGSNAQMKKTPKVKSLSRSKAEGPETGNAQMKALKVKSSSSSKPEGLKPAASPSQNGTRGEKRKRTSDVDIKKAMRTGRKGKTGVKSGPRNVKHSRKSLPRSGGEQATQKGSAKKLGTRQRSLSRLPAAEQNKGWKMSVNKKKDVSPGKGRGRHPKKLNALEGPESFVGKIVEKVFDGTLYSGTVVKFDRKTDYFKVKYEDGDQEDLELEELRAILVE